MSVNTVSVETKRVRRTIATSMENFCKIWKEVADANGSTADVMERLIEAGEADPAWREANSVTSLNSKASGYRQEFLKAGFSTEQVAKMLPKLKAGRVQGGRTKRDLAAVAAALLA